MQKQVMVVAAKRYSFKNDQGQMVEGTKLHYLDLEQEQDKDTAGSIPASVSLKYEEFSEIGKLPAIYDFEFGIKLQGNKPVVKFVGMKYVSQAEYTY